MTTVALQGNVGHYCCQRNFANVFTIFRECLYQGLLLVESTYYCFQTWDNSLWQPNIVKFSRNFVETTLSAIGYSLAESDLKTLLLPLLLAVQIKPIIAEFGPILRIITLIFEPAVWAWPGGPRRYSTYLSALQLIEFSAVSSVLSVKFRQCWLRCKIMLHTFRKKNLV